MAICDRVTDEDLELVVSAVRKMSKQLIGAGMNVEMILERDEIAACCKLNGLCPSHGPVTTE